MIGFVPLPEDYTSEHYFEVVEIKFKHRHDDVEEHEHSINTATWVQGDRVLIPTDLITNCENEGS